MQEILINLYLVIGGVILLVCFLIVIFCLNIKIKKLTCEKNLLQDKNDKIRSFKHDYMNTMTSIGGYVALNDMDGLKSFYSRIFSEMSDVNVLESINPKTINEASIYNLMVSKYSDASKKEIKFNFYSMFDFKSANICIYDFSKILGILLDNAIDSAQKSSKKQIDVSFETKKDNMQIVTIKNSYNNKEIDLNKIYEKDYSTKPVKSGFGLWEAKRILKNNKNTELNTFIEDSLFIQELILYKK